jgi:preprotein translocase subunit SecE
MMNRETKRMLQRQGQLRADGTLAPREPPVVPRRAPGKRRSWSAVVEFLRGVRTELKNVAWPDRSEIFNYSLVVFIVIVFLLFAIFFLNWAFGHAVSWLLTE